MKSKPFVVILCVVLASMLWIPCCYAITEALGPDVVVQFENGLILRLVGFDSLVVDESKPAFSPLPAGFASHLTVVNEDGSWTWERLASLVANGAPEDSTDLRVGDVEPLDAYTPSALPDELPDVSPAISSSWSGAVDASGKPVGFGTLTGDTETYTGQCVDGLYQGFGKIAFPDGSLRCVGTWRKGELNGYGSIIFADRSWAEGYFENGLISMGTIAYPDGQIYSGCFDTSPEAAFGTRMGYGELTTTSGRVQKLYWPGADAEPVKLNPRDETQARHMIAYSYFKTYNRAVTTSDMNAWLETRGQAWKSVTHITENLDAWAEDHQIADFDEISVRNAILKGYMDNFGFLPCEIQMKAHVKQCQIGLTTPAQIIAALVRGGTLND